MGEEETPGSGSGEEEIPSCCYGLRFIGGLGTSGRIPGARLLKIIRLLPKAFVNAQFVEIERIETGESHVYAFLGLGLGADAGISVSAHLGDTLTVVCCDTGDCPTFDFFEGFGRLTLASAGVGLGGSIAIFDFGHSGDCHLYFETLGVTVEVGAEIGTYVGYYYRLA